MLNITKKRVRNHLTYFGWQYLLLIAASFLIWNLIYTTTRYQAPDELKVEFYYEGALAPAQQDQIDALLKDCLAKLYPDMEETGIVCITTDEMYGDMQLTVWIAAAQGDLYLLSNKHFKAMSSGGAMLDLTPCIEDGSLDVRDLNLIKGYVKDDESGQKVLCGVPAELLPGLKRYGMDLTDKTFCVLTNGGNIENTVKLLNEFIRLGLEESPEA